ncbi:hypothetical protein KIF59_07480 [Enterobacter cloacae subsp. cloacae]|nr:hypothetical protein [Enterobacter cloacae subsp. cloacae]
MRAASTKRPQKAFLSPLTGSKIEIASSLNSTGMLGMAGAVCTLLLDTLQNILLLLLLNIGLLALALFG